MTGFLQFAAILLAVTILATGLSIGLVLRTLRRRLRPVPHIPSTAPLRWLLASGTSARLHRRLRATARIGVVTTQRIRKGFPDPANLCDIGDALGIEASRIDIALVELEPLSGPHRREAVRNLEKRVRRLEESTDRFCRATEDWTDAVGAHARSALDVDDALHSIEEATRTLRGLHTLSDTASDTPQSPANNNPDRLSPEARRSSAPS